MEAPTWSPALTSYSFNIYITDASKCMIQTRGQDPPFADDLSGMAALFIAGSAKHFVQPLSVKQFIRQAVHKWNRVFDEEFTDDLRINWIPLTIRVVKGHFEIEWGIHSIDRTVLIEPEFITPEAGDRARRRQKIRESRLRLAAAQLNAERLIASYYSKYGGAALSDSSLTSESE